MRGMFRIVFSSSWNSVDGDSGIPIFHVRSRWEPSDRERCEIMVSEVSGITWTNASLAAPLSNSPFISFNIPLGAAKRAEGRRTGISCTRDARVGTFFKSITLLEKDFRAKLLDFMSSERRH